jgi:hypothetical protein
MTSIFISHSQRDSEIKAFFNELFANTKIKAVFMEFEKMLGKEVNADKIETKINSTNAVFIILSENTDNLRHTRDWIAWESGRSFNKDIWVFIPERLNLGLNMVIPKLNHLVIYNHSDLWRKYIYRIINSYDDSNLLPISLATTTGGAILGGLSEENAIENAFLGGAIGYFGGLILVNALKTKIPEGFRVKCVNCYANYTIHAQTIRFRCPVCNTELHFT